MTERTTKIDANKPINVMFVDGAKYSARIVCGDFRGEEKNKLIVLYTYGEYNREAMVICDDCGNVEHAAGGYWVENRKEKVTGYIVAKLDISARETCRTLFMDKRTAEFFVNEEESCNDNASKTYSIIPISWEE